MIKLRNGETIPLEMHKVKVVQKTYLLPVRERLEAITRASNNTFLLPTREVFLDMLTDSGTNAMSDRQVAASMMADDSYAGSETFYRLKDKLKSFFGTDYFLPAHQGRACENIISETFIKEGSIVPMNYHFTTTHAHIAKRGGEIAELLIDEGFEITSDNPFKGNMCPDKLRNLIKTDGHRIPYVRMEAGTNLIGGQPFSLANLREISAICKANNIMLVLDASLLSDNLYFIKMREAEAESMSVHQIVLEIAKQCDIIYFSARKLGSARGGGICSNNLKLIDAMKELIPLYEGFLTYGGMSTREMEALVVGLDETLELDIISQGPMMIAHMAKELIKRGIPVITPPGGLGCHLDASEFVSHIPQNEYPAGALAAALYIISGVRGMERGTMSEARQPDGTETLSSMELLRLAVPRRMMTLSQIEYAVDRIHWLYDNRHLIEGLEFFEEPKIMRFFSGRLRPLTGWQDKLVEAFERDFGENSR